MNAKPYRFLLLSLLAAGMMAPIHAAPPPAPKPAQVIAPPLPPKALKASTPQLETLEEVGMGNLAIEWGRTKLDDVRKSGGGAIEARNDKTMELSWLCYTVEVGAAGRRIWLSSDPAAAGRVNGVTLAAQGGASTEASCPSLPTRLAPVGMIGGISLGDRRADVEAVLGRGSAAEWSRYEKCAPGKEGGKTCIAITLRYANNRVMQIHASQTRS